MYTVLAQIKAVMNSRPITLLSDDLNNLSYLTPGHFLVGDAPQFLTGHHTFVN